MKHQLRRTANCKFLLLLILSLIAIPGITAQRKTPVAVPDNGYANGAAYGKGWECKFGFKQKDERCIKVELPVNAYLNSRGEGWKCERGYRSQDDVCHEIKVPASGYLADSSGTTGWSCKRGYKASRDICEPIAVPANGYLTNSSFGSGWACERGYRETNTNCIAIDVPDNAHLVDKTYGPGWQCARGYFTLDKKACDKLVTPDNAHLDRSGNAWDCNRPYSRRGDACVQT